MKEFYFENVIRFKIKLTLSGESTSFKNIQELTIFNQSVINA